MIKYKGKILTAELKMPFQVDIRKFKSFPQFKERFLAFFPKNYQDDDMIDSCWNWTGVIRSRYGKICYGQKDYEAHRMSYLTFKGTIKPGLVVRHTCDNPACVNPKHLILGTMSDNSRDMVKRNRQGKQKLNNEAVKVIKWFLKYKPEKGLGKKLAVLHNVHPGIISKIKLGKIWSWVKV